MCDTPVICFCITQGLTFLTEGIKSSQVVLLRLECNVQTHILLHTYKASTAKEEVKSSSARHISSLVIGRSPIIGGGGAIPTTYPKLSNAPTHRGGQHPRHTVYSAHLVVAPRRAKKQKSAARKTWTEYFLQNPLSPSYIRSKLPKRPSPQHLRRHQSDPPCPREDMSLNQGCDPQS